MVVLDAWLNSSCVIPGAAHVTAMCSLQAMVPLDLWTDSGFKSLTMAGRVEKELHESEVAEGDLTRGLFTG